MEGFYLGTVVLEVGSQCILDWGYDSSWTRSFVVG